MKAKKNEEALETQLYKFLALMRKLEMQAKKESDGEKRGNIVKEQLPLLQAKFAYAVSRKEELQPLYQALEGYIQSGAIQSFKDFERLMDFVEAVIAYHKYLAQDKAEEKIKGQRDESQPKEHT